MVLGYFIFRFKFYDGLKLFLASSTPLNTDLQPLNETGVAASHYIKVKGSLCITKDIANR